MLREEYDGLIGLKRHESYLGGGVDYHVYTDYIEPLYVDGNEDKAKFVKSFGVVGLVGAYNAELKKIRAELKELKDAFRQYAKEAQETETRLHKRLKAVVAAVDGVIY